MAVLGIAMAAVFLAIATERLHKITAALLGSVVCVGLALALDVIPSYREVYAILSKDLGVLGVIVGTSILVDIAGQSGLFQFVAVKIAKRAQGDPRRLLGALVALTVLFVSFLTIAPGTLIVVSLALVLARTLDLRSKPYLVAIALAANSGALSTFASGICTLMIGSAAGIPYAHFLVVSLPMALATAWIVWAVVLRCYGNELADPAVSSDERRARLASFDEWAMVKDRIVFRNCAVILVLTVVGFATARLFGVGLDFVAIAGGTAALLFSGFDPEQAVKKVNWTVIVFFVGLFAMIGVVEHTGLLEALAHGIGAVSGGNVYATLVLLVLFTVVLSGLMDNIPVAATLIPIVKSLAVTLPGEPLWWGLVLSANLGGNGTPIGSVSSVIALHALHDTGGGKITWGEFLRVGGLVLLLQTTLVLVWLLGLTALDLLPALPKP